MKAIGVTKYGDASVFEARNVDEPGKPTGRELLIEYEELQSHELSDRLTFVKE